MQKATDIARFARLSKFAEIFSTRFTETTPFTTYFAAGAANMSDHTGDTSPSQSRIVDRPRHPLNDLPEPQRSAPSQSTSADMPLVEGAPASVDIHNSYERINNGLRQMISHTESNLAARVAELDGLRAQRQQKSKKTSKPYTRLSRTSSSVLRSTLGQLKFALSLSTFKRDWRT